MFSFKRFTGCTPILLFVLFFTTKVAFAQNPKIDSLLTVLKTAKEDTNKVNILNNLSAQFIKAENLNTGTEYANKAMALSQKLSFKKGIATALHRIGNVYHTQINYSEALKYYSKSLTTFEETRNKEGIAVVLNNIAIIFFSQSDFQESLKYYLKVLKIHEEAADRKKVAAVYSTISSINGMQGNYFKAHEAALKSLKIYEALQDKDGMAGCYGNIGLIYENQKQYNEALKYHLKSLKLSLEMGDKPGEARSYGNIGIVYLHQKNYEKAWENYAKCLQIEEEVGNKRSLAQSYNNMGDLYTKIYEEKRTLKIPINNYDIKYISSYVLLDSAKIYQIKANEILKKTGDKWTLSINLRNIGDIFFLQNEPVKALQYYKEAEIIAEEIDAKEELKNVHQRLSNVHRELGNYKKALIHYEQYKTLSDTLLNAETQKSIVQKDMRYEFEKKEHAAKLEQEKKNVLHKAELEKEQIQRYGLYGGLSLVLAFSGLLLNRFRITHRQKQVIEEKNKIVEEKNNDILSSIKYAKRIQEAILPPDNLVKETLPDSFVLYKPKDIVSGDFYWLEKVAAANSSIGEKYTPNPSYRGEFPPNKEGKGGVVVLLAAVDCTGHGVPGAFMTIVGHNGLTRATNEHNLTKPSDILNYLNKTVHETLRQTYAESSVRDGMDISLCTFSPSPEGEGRGEVKLQYAGANNPLWIIRKVSLPDGEGLGVGLTEIKGDKHPIGIFVGEELKPFTNHEITLQKGDTIYIFTDGFADQFGGDKQKKFTYKKLKELLLSIQDKTMQQQNDILNESLETWKGNLEQIDDICVIGVRV